MMKIMFITEMMILVLKFSMFDNAVGRVRGVVVVVFQRLLLKVQTSRHHCRRWKVGEVFGPNWTTMSNFGICQRDEEGDLISKVFITTCSPQL